MNVVITGASKGIGYEIVKAFAAETGNKILGISRNNELLHKLHSDCKLLPGGTGVFVLPYDLEQIYSHNDLADKISSIMPCVDILVNNAGLLIKKPFSEITPNDLDRIFNVNFKSIFSLIQLLLPSFSRNSHIVNISSMGGVQGSIKFKGLSLYSASKGALSTLSECLAEELQDYSISVNCLALGSVQTEMLAEAFPGYKAPVNAKEMAEFIKYFAVHGHRLFNGKIIPVSLSTP